MLAIRFSFSTLFGPSRHSLSQHVVLPYGLPICICYHPRYVVLKLPNPHITPKIIYKSRHLYVPFCSDSGWCHILFSLSSLRAVPFGFCPLLSLFLKTKPLLSASLLRCSLWARRFFSFFFFLYRLSFFSLLFHFYFSFTSPSCT